MGKEKRQGTKPIHIKEKSWTIIKKLKKPLTKGKGKTKYEKKN